jgi:hypothetical protein
MTKVHYYPSKDTGGGGLNSNHCLKQGAFQFYNTLYCVHGPHSTLRLAASRKLKICTVP